MFYFQAVTVTQHQFPESKSLTIRRYQRQIRYLFWLRKNEFLYRLN